ncbi:hypothetical protein Tco_0129437 [Tanacetum coccineum]
MIIIRGEAPSDGGPGAAPLVAGSKGQRPWLGSSCQVVDRKFNNWYQELGSNFWKLGVVLAKGNSGERLYNHKKSQGFVRNEDQVSGSGAEEYDSADVMMAISYDGGNVPLGDDRGSTQQCMKNEVVKYLVVAGIQQLNRLVKETNVTLLAKVKCIFLRYGNGIVGNKLWRYGSVQVLQGVEFEVEPQYKEDNNEDAFTVAAAEKIYAHESLIFNDTVACEVISKWKAGLKEDIDARSDVYMLNNSCRKCSNDNDGYYSDYTLVKGNVLGIEIVKDQRGNTLRSIRDYDVEKNGKWSYVYAVGSQFKVPLLRSGSSACTAIAGRVLSRGNRRLKGAPFWRSG